MQFSDLDFTSLALPSEYTSFAASFFAVLSWRRRIGKRQRGIAFTDRSFTDGVIWRINPFALQCNPMCLHCRLIRHVDFVLLLVRILMKPEYTGAQHTSAKYGATELGFIGRLLGASYCTAELSSNPLRPYRLFNRQMHHP